MRNPDARNRQSIRLRDFDYSGTGAYFITVCTWQRQCLLGQVVDGAVRLNDMGMVVRDCWTSVPQHFPHVELDAFVMMPNHVHILFWIVNEHPPVGAQHAAPLSVGSTRAKDRAQHAAPLPMSPRGITPHNVRAGSVGAIIRSFKSAATKRINAVRDNAGCPVWQRNYYEHVIRDEGDLQAIRQYIAENPAQWDMDTNHPARI